MWLSDLVDLRTFVYYPFRLEPHGLKVSTQNGSLSLLSYKIEERVNELRLMCCAPAGLRKRVANFRQKAWRASTFAPQSTPSWQRQWGTQVARQ